MKIISLGHRKRTGKDTLAQFIVTALRTQSKGLRIKKAGFADELKRITHHLFRWAGLKDGEYYEMHPEEREIVLPAIKMTPRQLWLGIGNRMRDVYNDIWLDFLLKDPDCDVLIIKDMRFPAEFNRIHEMGGKCIKVVNSRIPDTDDEADIALAHVPDTVWDRLVYNNGTKHELHHQALQIVENYLL